MGALQAKIDQKTEELKNLQDIKLLTASLAEELDQISEKLGVMTDGAESISLILSSWKNVVNSVSLASLGLAQHGQASARPLPETLVRVDLHQDKDNAP